jgi:type IV pilus assembly protein PilV
MVRSPQRGFTLLEVLVALLVFSLGLIGLAGLLTVSVRTNHSAYLRTQATFLAQALADRMHANSMGLWAGNYNLNSIAAPAAPASGLSWTTDIMSQCTSGSPCNPAGVAARDLLVWQYQVQAFLPNPRVAVNCNAPASTPNLTLLPPYSTTCEILMQWSELAINDQDPSQLPQYDSFDWILQP